MKNYIFIFILLFLIASCKKEEKIEYTIEEIPQISILDKPAIKVILKDELINGEKYKKLSKEILNSEEKYIGKDYLKIIYLKDNEKKQDYYILGLFIINKNSKRPYIFDETIRQYNINCNSNEYKNKIKKEFNVNEEEFKKNIEKEAIKQCEKYKIIIMNQAMAINFDGSELLNKYIENKKQLDELLENRVIMIGSYFESIKKAKLFGKDINLITLYDKKIKDNKIYCMMDNASLNYKSSFLENIIEGDYINISGRYEKISNNNTSGLKKMLKLDNSGVFIADCMFYSK